MNRFVAYWLLALCMVSPAVCSAQAQPDGEAQHKPVGMNDFGLRVVDEAGKPIEGATVVVDGWRCKENPSSWHAWRAAIAGPMPKISTDQQGVARFQYPNPTKFGKLGEGITLTTLTMHFQHPDFISASAEVSIDAEDFEQTLKPGCHVTYSAVDESGMAVENFAAFILGPGYNAQWKRTEGTIQSRAVPDGAWQTMLVSPQDDGVTLFSGVLPAFYKSGREVTIRNVTLLPGLRVRGRLSAQVPRPVLEGVVVAFAQPKPTQQALEKHEAISWSDSAVIQQDGSFEFASLPRGGRLQLIAICRGWVIQDQPRPNQQRNLGQFKSGILIELAAADIADNLLDDVELPMEEAGAISVTVKHLDGSPAAGVQVGASPNQMLEDMGTQILGESYPFIAIIQSQIDGTEPPSFWQEERKSRYIQTTNAEGKAVLYDLPAGNWEVFVGSKDLKLVTEQEQPRPLFPKIMVQVAKQETVSLTATVEPIER